MHNRKLAALAVASLTLLAPAAASAHVTLQPNELPAGGFKRLNVRVPNERDNASTTKVEVKFPPGFLFISYEPVAGWDVSVKKAKLDPPVEVYGEQVTERVDTVTFTAERGDGIKPGQFRDFGLSLSIPEKPQTLTFPSIQTYSNDEVVRWIGPEDADEPAPRVTLTAAGKGGHGATGAAGAAAAAVPAGEEEDDDGEDTLVIVALALGALGLVAGVAGLSTARRARSA